MNPVFNIITQAIAVTSVLGFTLFPMGIGLDAQPNRFISNQASTGGAISFLSKNRYFLFSPRTVFRGNQAVYTSEGDVNSGNGGAILFGESCSYVYFLSPMFVNNGASGYGGAVRCSQVNFQINFASGSFVSNTAQNGGAVSLGVGN